MENVCNFRVNVAESKAYIYICCVVSTKMPKVFWYYTEMICSGTGIYSSTILRKWMYSTAYRLPLYCHLFMWQQRFYSEFVLKCFQQIDNFCSSFVKRFMIWWENVANVRSVPVCIYACGKYKFWYSASIYPFAVGMLTILLSRNCLCKLNARSSKPNKMYTWTGVDIDMEAWCTKKESSK